MKELKISADSKINELKIPLKAFGIHFSGVKIFGTNSELDLEFNLTISEVINNYNSESLSNDKIVRLVRDLFKSGGIDPTRWRPSSEAMLRRIVKEKGLFRINSLVDINNITSIRSRLPIGLYDISKIKGEIKISIGDETHSYIGLTGREYNTDKKLIVLDEEGIIGSPIVDSDRTKITDQTSGALAIIFSHCEEQEGISKEAAKLFITLMERFHPESASENLQITI
jgi:DNA/RNA-binding domain of Phe-tRNA-synthetase-like protein